MQELILRMLGDEQLIKLKTRNISLDGLAPFAFITIYAVQAQGQVNQLRVETNLVAQGFNKTDFYDYQHSFDVPLDGSEDLKTLLIESQLAVLGAAHSNEHLDEDELSVIQERFKGPELLTDAQMQEWLIEEFGTIYTEYESEQNMVHATHFAFSQVLTELKEIFGELGISTANH